MHVDKDDAYLIHLGGKLKAQRKNMKVAKFW